VEELNNLAFNQELDITKISFFAYAFVSQYYQILNSGSALGFKNGPLLISKKDLDFKSNKELSIAIPGEYTTANFLFSIAYPEHYNKQEYLFSEIESAVSNNLVDTGLIIHENRFTYLSKGLKKLIDLGEYWEEKTKMPIPLGGIIIKRGIDIETKTLFNTVLRQSIEYAFNNPESPYHYMKSHAQEMTREIMYNHVNLYVNEFSRDLGKKGKQAIELLYKTAIKKKLIEKITTPIFAI
jgi:1,4-dihydroxy-6-naphthoate synthase